MSKPDGAANAGQKQRGVPFRRGRSGNPAGRPQGSRNTATLILDALADGEAEAVLRKLVDAAKGGAVAFAWLVWDWSHPVGAPPILRRIERAPK